MDDRQLPLTAPANAGVLAWFRSRRAGPERVERDPETESCAPTETKDPYLRLGAHPDLLSRMWGELGKTLPESCAWVVLGMPVLSHPHTGVIFAYAGGTSYMLRLAPGDLAAALAAGTPQQHQYPGVKSLGMPPTTLDLREIGPEWVMGGWRKPEPDWMRNAFDHATAGWPEGTA